MSRAKGVMYLGIWAVRSMGTKTSLSLHNHLKNFLLICVNSRKDKKTAINCMKIEGANMNYMYVFFKDYLKKKKKKVLSVSIVRYLHWNYSGTCVFKDVAISCQIFYKSFLAAVEGNPATPQWMTSSVWIPESKQTFTLQRKPYCEPNINITVYYTPLLVY